MRQGTNLLRLGERLRERLRSLLRCFCWLLRSRLRREGCCAAGAAAVSPRSQGCCSIWPAVARFEGTKLSMGMRKSAKERACRRGGRGAGMPVSTSAAQARVGSGEIT